MTASIKTIETEYNGLRFRSRTEARWAVFFDGAHIPWQYEPEGFEMEGVRYVPDFWLPAMNSYFEVKGLAPTDAEMDKARLLVKHTGRFIMIAEGSPRRGESIVYLTDDPDFASYGRLWLASDRRNHDVFWLKNANCGFVITTTQSDHYREPVDDFGPVADGYLAAATHRFDWRTYTAKKSGKAAA